MALRASIDIPTDFAPLPYVDKAVRNSDCRTPIIFFQEEGSPFESIFVLAQQRNTALWSFDVSALGSGQNVVDYIEVGSSNGDWVYIVNCDLVDPSFFREVARILYNLKPEPTKFPRRDIFRCFFGVAKSFDPNAPTGLPFPTLFMQHAILARNTDVENPKWCRIMPADQALFAAASQKHVERRAAGRDSDSESDVEEHNPISGIIFHKSVERAAEIERTHVVLAKQELTMAIDAEDCETIVRIIRNGDFDLNRLLKEEMTPLQYACCKQLLRSTATLLDLGADPNIPREADGRPPLFMSIDSVELATMLVNAGADLFFKYEGFRADAHPDTDPVIAAYLLEQRQKE